MGWTTKEGGSLIDPTGNPVSTTYSSEEIDNKIAAVQASGGGVAGPTGPQGPKGDTGDQGLQGLQGLKGDTGDTGATGPQGIQGLKGDTGATGSQGIQGVKGDTGLQGLQGLTGATGATGAQGPKGDTGAAGPAGGVTKNMQQLTFNAGQTLTVTMPDVMLMMKILKEVIAASKLNTNTANATAKDFWSGQPASYAMDGSTSTYWRQATNGDLNAYWQYDFGSVQTVTDISLTVGTSPSYRPDSVVIKYSNDGSTWTTGETIALVNGVNAYTFASAFSARYVRVTIGAIPAGWSYLQLQEVAINGSTITDTEPVTADAVSWQFDAVGKVLSITYGGSTNGTKLKVIYI